MTPLNVIITGATRGLGKSLSRIFLEQGASVHGISRTRKAWPSARKDFPAAGKINLYQVDLTQEKAVRQFVQTLKRKKISPDILINNAGYGGGLAAVEKTRLADFNKLLTDNLTSAFLMCKHLLPFFQKKKAGLILNVSSMAGIRAVPGLFGYSAAKFGMVALSQSVAKENAKLEKFKCITVCPGGINTEMRASLFGRKDAARQQSPDFVSRVMMDIVRERIPLNSGSDIIIRHGKIWGINPPPAA